MRQYSVPSGCLFFFFFLLRYIFRWNMRSWNLKKSQNVYALWTKKSFLIKSAGLFQFKNISFNFKLNNVRDVHFNKWAKSLYSFIFCYNYLIFLRNYFTANFNFVLSIFVAIQKVLWLAIPLYCLPTNALFSLCLSRKQIWDYGSGKKSKYSAMSAFTSYLFFKYLFRFKNISINEIRIFFTRKKKKKL